MDALSLQLFKEEGWNVETASTLNGSFVLGRIVESVGMLSSSLDGLQCKKDRITSRVSGYSPLTAFLRSRPLGAVVFSKGTKSLAFFSGD